MPQSAGYLIEYKQIVRRVASTLRFTKGYRGWTTWLYFRYHEAGRGFGTVSSLASARALLWWAGLEGVARFFGTLDPKMLPLPGQLHDEGMCLNGRKPKSERRRWERLPLAIPVFVRSRDDSGKEFLEFATAWNVSAGGALVAVKRPLRLSAQVSLEIPSTPVSVFPYYAKVARNMRAKPIWVTHAEGHHIVGLKFVPPLLPKTSSPFRSKRKVASSR